jgi:hypothetical protein
MVQTLGHPDILLKHLETVRQAWERCNTFPFCRNITFGQLSLGWMIDSSVGKVTMSYRLNQLIDQMIEAPCKQGFNACQC